MPTTVEIYLEGLTCETRAMIEALRSIVRRSTSGMDETIKWNAPSFAIAGEDRITLGVERKGGVRLVLHRGAKPRPETDLSAIDPDRIAKWPSPDRGVATFRSLDEIHAREAELGRLCAGWVDVAS